LFYAVLIDLADAVADELAVPFDRISLEMLFRGLYHFHHAYSQGGLLTRFCFLLHLKTTIFIEIKSLPLNSLP